MAAFGAHKKMEEKGKESGHWLLFFLVVVVISFGVVASKYFGYQPPKGYFVTSIMLGMLTLFDSDVFDGLEETTVGSMGVPCLYWLVQ